MSILSLKISFSFLKIILIGTFMFQIMHIKKMSEGQTVRIYLEYEDQSLISAQQGDSNLDENRNAQHELLQNIMRFQMPEFIIDVTEETQSILKKKITPKKNDEVKNLYPNMLRVVVDAMLSKCFNAKLKKIWRRVIDKECAVAFEEVLKFCSTLKGKNCTLAEIFDLLNFASSFGRERTIKRTIYIFLNKYLGKYYSLKVLRSDKCGHKEKYLRGKNILRYLPALKPKKCKKQVNTSL